MRKVKIVGGALLIILGVLLAASSTASGVMLIASGLLLLPQISDKLPDFKGKKTVLGVACAGLFLLSFCVLSESEPSDTSKSTASDTSKPEVSDTSFDVSALPDWIRGYLNANVYEGVTEEDAEAVKTIPEEDFVSTWKSVLYEAITNDLSNEAYNSAAKKLNHGAKLCMDLYGHISAADNLALYAEQLSNIDDSIETWETRYGGNYKKAFESYSQGSFYINQRLELVDRNLLEKIYKEIDSYQSKDYSEWIAYNVNYIGYTAFPGDICYVIHAETLNPFTQSGEYFITYYDTGETTTLTNSRGFNQDVPVYHMLAETEQFESDLLAYSSLGERIAQCRSNIETLLLGGEGQDTAPVSAAAPSSTNTSSGNVFETAFYTLTLPYDWNERCGYEQRAGEGNGYSVEFYEKQSYMDEHGGTLFSIVLLPVNEDYSYYPECYPIGTLNAAGRGNYNVLVMYPSDVQFSDRYRNDYEDLSNDIDGIVASFTARADANCTFTATGDISSNDDYLLPTNSVYITDADLAGFSQSQIVLIRNEIYARHGYNFQNQEVRSYFENQGWYSPIPGLDSSTFDESVFNEYERKNLDTIVLYEKAQGWR